MILENKALRKLERTISSIFQNPIKQHRTVYVVLQDEILSNPIAGVFSNRKKANAYMDELIAKYPGCTCEMWSMPINHRMFGYGGKKYMEVIQEEDQIPHE